MTTVWFSALNSEDKDVEEDPFSPMEGITPPLFGKPKEIGYFSVDAKRNILFDNSQMRYLVLPLKTRGINFDLNVNLTNRCEQYIILEKMHQTLTWLLQNREKINFSCSHGLKTGIDFITVRGTLALILCTPYLKGHYREQWEICASKFNGTIYFSRIDTDIDIEEDKNASHHLVSCQSWGYKFEQYMTTGTIDGICNIQSETFQMEEYCTMLLNKIRQYSILYKAEIDAVIPHRFPGPGSGNTSCYTELKTSKHLQGEVHKYKFHRYKLLTWWAQSFLAGIPEIICGLRNDDGIVSDLEIFTVSTIPQKALGLWSPDACLSFCEKFLNFLKRIVIEDNHNIVYKFHYKGDDMIYCSKITHPCSRYKILPDWYIREIVGDVTI